MKKYEVPLTVGWSASRVWKVLKPEPIGLAYKPGAPVAESSFWANGACTTNCRASPNQFLISDEVELYGV